MNRNILRQIHLTAALSSCLLIVAFWSSTVLSELFLSYQAVANVKQVIVYALIVQVLSMVITGVTGMKMGRRSKNKRIAAKRKRMPIIALNGLLILIPCAVFLNMRASVGAFDGVFYGVQVVELVAGMVNFSLMVCSMKEGWEIRHAKFER